MYEVDARGLSCPEPVMMTAKAMQERPEEALKVLVTEQFSRINVEKFGVHNGRKVTVTELSDGFELIME